MANATVLFDGLRLASSVASANASYLQFPLTTREARVTLVLRGAACDLFASSIARPNATWYEWSSAYEEGDVVSIAHTDPALVACREGGGCVLHVAVLGPSGAPFELTASTTQVGTGFDVVSPEDVAGSYAFEGALFGPPLPTSPLTACLTYVGNACAPLPSNLSGCVALVDRGGCPLPQAYFANKVAVAQAAGARAVVVANDRPAEPNLIMQSVSGDQAASVAIPAIFVSRAVGARLAAAAAPSVSLYRPSDLPSPLAPGEGVDVALAAGEHRFYQIFLDHWYDGLALNVSTRFGAVGLTVYRYAAEGAYDASNWQEVAYSYDAATGGVVVAELRPAACAATCWYQLKVEAAGAPAAFRVATRAYEAVATLTTAAPSPPLPLPPPESYAFHRYVFAHNLLLVHPPAWSAKAALSLSLSNASAARAFVGLANGTAPPRPTAAAHACELQPRCTLRLSFAGAYGPLGFLGCETVDCPPGVPPLPPINASVGAACAAGVPCALGVAVLSAGEGEYSLRVDEAQYEPPPPAAPPPAPLLPLLVGGGTSSAQRATATPSAALWLVVGGGVLLLLAAAACALRLAARQRRALVSAKPLAAGVTVVAVGSPRAKPPPAEPPAKEKQQKEEEEKEKGGEAAPLWPARSSSLPPLRGAARALREYSREQFRKSRSEGAVEELTGERCAMMKYSL